MAAAQTINFITKLKKTKVAEKCQKDLNIQQERNNRKRCDENSESSTDPLNRCCF